MRELMLKALADAGITVNTDISDDDLMAQYDALKANQSSDEAAAAAAAAAGDEAAAAAETPEAITNALKPVMDKLDSLEQKVNKTDTDELDRLATIVGNSDKFPGLDAEAAKNLGVKALTDMAANCLDSHGLPLHINDDSSSDAGSYDMPE